MKTAGAQDIWIWAYQLPSTHTEVCVRTSPGPANGCCHWTRQGGCGAAYRPTIRVLSAPTPTTRVASVPRVRGDQLEGVLGRAIGVARARSSPWTLMHTRRKAAKTKIQSGRLCRNPLSND